MEFVTGAGDKVDRGIPEIERKMTHRLHCIGVKDRTIQFAQLPYRLDIEDIPDLIVGMHQADQRLPGTRSQLLLKVLLINMPVRQYMNIAQRCFSTPMQMLYHVQRSMMFQLRRDNVGTAQVPNRRSDRRIRALRSTGSKEDLCRMRMEDPGNRFPRILNRQP